MTLEPFTRIVQTWRSANFTGEHADSAIEVLFEEEGTVRGFACGTRTFLEISWAMKTVAGRRATSIR